MPRPALLTAVSGVLEGPGRHFVPTPRLQRATGIHLLRCSSLLRLWYVAVSRDVHLQYEVLSVSLFTMSLSTNMAHLQGLSSILLFVQSHNTRLYVAVRSVCDRRAFSMRTWYNVWELLKEV